ncbi:uncharacterized protein EDB93DRAFT_1079780, partial [Suillus bovinus]|uniref:uncharacterized protein n=1 Tax=Suillus bovinus TaxID=48563 RepID=UPI001B88424D
VTSNAQAAVDKETSIKLQAITDAYEANKDAVVKKLLDRVLLITPKLHDVRCFYLWTRWALISLSQMLEARSKHQSLQC